MFPHLLHFCNTDRETSKRWQDPQRTQSQKAGSRSFYPRSPSPLPRVGFDPSGWSGWMWWTVLHSAPSVGSAPPPWDQWCWRVWRGRWLMTCVWLVFCLLAWVTGQGRRKVKDGERTFRCSYKSLSDRMREVWWTEKREMEGGAIQPCW